MCGISGVYGANAPLKATLISVAQINRGRQGCGVAYMCSNRIKIIKEPVSPLAFFMHNYRKLASESMIAIGHNRMPSKGAVSYSNTHPFLSCRGEFALVHNGHSVNDGLAEILKKDGHRIMGDTDSEILCHQLESLYLEKGDMVDAINGLYDNKFSGAILVLMRDGTMYGVTSSFYPLYVLQSGREIYLASTSEAIAHRGTPRRLESWEIAEVKRGKLRIHKAIHKEEPTVWVKKDRIGKLWNLMNWYE